MVVDDEQGVVDVLRDFLSLKGYDVNGAISGEQALEMLKNREVDLILLDMVMPGLNGWEVAKIAKEKYPGIKIVVITAFPKRIEGLLEESSTEAIFFKPFKLKELCKKLDELLNHATSSGLDENQRSKIKTRTIFIRAGLLFVEPSTEISNFLTEQFKLLACRGQHYDVDVAINETELFRRLSFVEPDIVIFEESFLNTLDSRIPERILLFSSKTKEVISYNLVSTTYNYDNLEGLIEKVRSLCIKNGLIEIG